MPAMPRPYRFSPLRDGELVGLAAPASPFKLGAFKKGLDRLKQLGFRARYRQDLFSRQGYLAGSDRRRAEELNRLFADPEVKVILAVRGGYGTARIIPHLDERVIRTHPKLLVGYSDLTLLQLYLWQRFSVPSLHGPMLLPQLAFAPLSYLKKVVSFLQGETGPIKIKPQHFLRKGTAEGVLVGGCLSLVVTTLGTPFEIETKDSILFLEDIGEKVYEIDRMLTHLKNAGKFKMVRGILIGRFADKAVRKMMTDFFSDFKGPIAYGLPFGHVSEPLLLPIGIRARLHLGKSGTLNFDRLFS
ncbi:MAG: LD-carboxypeptidase [Deltaproteobacteria bacterium]|nr:LD-carboxypeptidase [Deltaproteobacteria bacterium]